MKGGGGSFFLSCNEIAFHSFVDESELFSSASANPIVILLVGPDEHWEGEERARWIIDGWALHTSGQVRRGGGIGRGAGEQEIKQCKVVCAGERRRRRSLQIVRYSGSRPPGTVRRQGGAIKQSLE